MALQTEDPVTTAPETVPAAWPLGETAREQAHFEKAIIAAALAGLTALIALIVAFSALSQNAVHTTVVKTIYAGKPGVVQTQAPVVAPKSVTMGFRSDVEHGKLGPDGKWHDAVTNANFTVHAGAQVTITMINYDTAPHSFTAPGLGVDSIVAGGSPTSPSQAKIAFRAPAKPGRYLWHCKIPCDPWAMMHIGYMEGYVTVVA
ncbi:MAG: cupredoxin domain-containing protein [Solirubrobacteraceae bacterium]